MEKRTVSLILKFHLWDGRAREEVEALDGCGKNEE
jgi:hypothetical protein